MAVEAATQDMPDFPLSDSSSELSVMSRSPSPPYPSPPASQLSSRTSPGPDVESSTCPSSTEDDYSRPLKRRKLSSGMPRPTKRLDLPEFEQLPTSDQQAELDRLLKVLRRNRKIVVVAGAGISVSAGIPDFRSSSGLFHSLKAQYNLKGSGKHLFDAAVYRDSSSTSSFHDMVRSLSNLTKSAKPTPFHHLIARLAAEDRLLRLYTQNVDGIDTSLEPLATQVPLPKKGPWPKTIQLHGGLEKMTCTKCNHLSDFEPTLFDGPVPPACEKCEEVDFARTEFGGKRSHGVGRLRPRMVLYNEHNPDDEAIGAVIKADLRRRPDAIIVVGTTLKIPGVKRIVREMCSIVRNHRDGLAVWINNDPEPSAKEFEDSWDLIVKGTCDEIARRADMRQWHETALQDSQLVTEDEYKLVKEKAEPVVVLHTPSKANKFKDLASLPTPVHSPRPSTTANTGASKADILPVSGQSGSRKLKDALKQPSNKAKVASKKIGAGKPTKGSTAIKTNPSKRQASASKHVAKLAKDEKSIKITNSFGISKKLALPDVICGKKEEALSKVEPPLTGMQGPKEQKKKAIHQQPQSQCISVASLCNPDPAESYSVVVNRPPQTPKKPRLSSFDKQTIRTSNLPSSQVETCESPQRPEVEPLTPHGPLNDPTSPTRPIPSPLTNKRFREPLNDSTLKINHGSIFFALNNEMSKQKSTNNDESLQVALPFSPIGNHPDTSL